MNREVSYPVLSMTITGSDKISYLYRGPHAQSSLILYEYEQYTHPAAVFTIRNTSKINLIDAVR